MPDLTRAQRYAQALLRCPSVTPAASSVFDLIETWLKPYGFEIHRPVFSEPGTRDVENLYARRGANPSLMFAGHVDVVPVGTRDLWSQDPFGGEVTGDILWGRGACDMKGGVAASIAAVLDILDAQSLAEYAPIGLSFLITGDEEGPAINGTVKVLEWAAERGERFVGSILGEPTNPETLGDMLKIGRRGSLSGDLVVEGKQGHIAYPHLARNPIDGLMRAMAALKGDALDAGNPFFSPSNLEFTSIDVGNDARNIIPAAARAKFNIRFNDHWNAKTLEAELRRRISTLNTPIEGLELTFLPTNAEAFLTKPGPFVDLVRDIVQAETGRLPVLSTTGGTSDARFIQAYCPVVEFGLVGASMHQIDEHTSLADLEKLSLIYRKIIAKVWETS
jgi:succinyl-diaminopimelate desuccinylase